MTVQAVDIDLENSRNSRVASAIVDLLVFYKTGEGLPQEIVTKMRFVVETYCTYTYPSFFDSDDSLASIIEKIRTTGEQHPACALLDALDAIQAFSRGHTADLILTALSIAPSISMSSPTLFGAP